MELRSWIKRHAGDRIIRAISRDKTAPASQNGTRRGPKAPKDAATGAGRPARQPVDLGAWEPLPAYLPVDPREHTAACVIASAMAAGDHPASEFRIKRVLMANPEHRTVSVIATALAAGALPESSFTVKNIYKMKEEGSHAA